MIIIDAFPDSDPVCGSNASNAGVIEGDHLLMWCSVNYSGNLDPVLEWSRSDGNIVYSTVSYCNDSFPRAITSIRSQMINFNDHSVVYLCKTYFTTLNIGSQHEYSSKATNAPDYNAECKVTVKVLCKLSPLFISGVIIF